MSAPMRGRGPGRPLVIDGVFKPGDIVQPVPPAPPIPPDQSLNSLNRTQAELMRQAGLAIPVVNTGQPANPAVPASSTFPCPKCRDKGWVFVSILDGTTRRCECGEDLF